MNASNNFTVVGFICKDAEVRNFEKSSLARFGVSIKTTEKKGGVEITSSSIQSFESWIKNGDQPILPQGRQAKGGLYLKQKRPVKRMAKDYYLPRTSHHLQKSEAKGRGASIPQTLPVYPRLPQPDR